MKIVKKNNKERRKMSESEEKANQSKAEASDAGNAVDSANKKPHNSRGRGRSPAEIRESYARFYATKKKAIDLEARNVQHLVLWPASDADTNKKKFYNMGGRSAIIFAYEIGPRLKRKPMLRHDMDNGPEKFHSGVCSIADLEKLTRELESLGIKKLPPTKGYEELVIFKLNREYSKEEIKGMAKEEQRRMDELNKALYSTVLYPDIHRQILDLKRAIPNKVKNMDSIFREIIGVKLIDSLMVLIRAYSQMAHGDLDELEAGKKMVLELDMMLAEISMLNELKLWDVTACVRIANIINGAKQIIKGKIINKHERAGAKQLDK